MEGTKEPRSVCVGRAEGKQYLCTTSFYHEKGIRIKYFFCFRCDCHMVLWTECGPSNFTCCCPLLSLAVWRWDAVGKEVRLDGVIRMLL